MVIVPLFAPSAIVVAAPPAFSVVTVEFNKLNVVVFAVKSPPAINTSPTNVP